MRGRRTRSQREAGSRAVVSIPVSCTKDKHTPAQDTASSAQSPSLSFGPQLVFSMKSTATSMPSHEIDRTNGVAKKASHIRG